jgi:hypothetical protein|tara:strand:+ start:940 stop:2826 length:1887 start_codon:yes stop_codon:yes gene_type:complete
VRFTEALAKIKKYKSWGMHLTPANYKPEDKKKDKKPVAVRNGDGTYHWSVNVKGFDWTDEQLAEALMTKRLGVYHNPKKYDAPGSMFHDAESDDKTGRVNNYLDCFPATRTIGKKLNGTIVPTHKLYKLPEGTKVKHYEYDHHKEGKKVELLCSGISVIDGLDRIILDDREPAVADPEVIKQHLQLASFLAEIEPYWPAKNLKKRDEAHLRLAGALAKQTDFSLELKEKFVRKFLTITNDTDEIDNRLNKLKAQEEAVKTSPDSVFGIDALAKYLKGNFPAFDKINNTRKDAAEDVQREYPLVNASMNIIYPPTKFIMKPIFTERSSNQIFGEPESGKTLVGMALGINMSSGHDYVGFKSIKKVPVGYVEGELPGTEFISRKDTIVNGLVERGLDFNSNWFFYLTRDDLEMHGFKYGFDPIAVSRNLSDKDAIDYGIQGRKFIENWVQRIEKQTGVKPFFILDNITALADIDENRAQDWTPLIQWITHMKSKGYSNCFDHHANKQPGGKSSSGSGAKERLLDTSIKFEKLMPDQRFEMPGQKNLQCRVSFTKSRNFGGGQWDKPFLLTMNEDGKFTKYPDLTKDDFAIIDLWKQKISVKEMESDPRLKIKEKTIYKHIVKLKKWEIIK